MRGEALWRLACEHTQQLHGRVGRQRLSRQATFQDGVVGVRRAQLAQDAQALHRTADERRVICSQLGEQRLCDHLLQRCLCSDQRTCLQQHVMERTESCGLEAIVAHLELTREEGRDVVHDSLLPARRLVASLGQVVQQRPQR